MKAMIRMPLFDRPVMNTRIKSANIQRSEKWIGFFLAPALVFCMFYMCGQTYLNTFYTDVLKMSHIGGGLFLGLLPIFSKIFDAITNVLMGILIEKTRTRQGKARPWLLISAPLVAICGILLFTVPSASLTVQVIWVIVSYNLYFCMAYTIYNISHQLMIPLSTRNSRQRDSLAMFSSMGTSMIPGSVVSMLFPMIILPIIGVDQGKWITAMGIISILAFPAIILEYYFTRERVTEEIAETGSNELHSYIEQFKGCLKSKYWIVIMGIVIIYQLYNNFQQTSALYYANWVLGSYNDGHTYTLMNVVGQAPLGIGVFILWPLVRKIGKRKCMMAGMMLSVIGYVLCALFPHNMQAVLAGLAVRSFGQLPITYTLMAMLADALDHVEWVNGFRCDGFSASTFTVTLTIAMGLSTGFFNLFLGRLGYVPPLADGSFTAQSAAVQSFFVIGSFVIPAVGCFLIAFLSSFFNVEKELPGIRRDIIERQKEAAAARGEEYVSPEEKAERELAEQERIAEENRIRELKARCAKKGLSFEEEETKYQTKRAATAAKKNKKK